MDVDEDTKHKRYWRWARIYVNFAGISLLAMMELIVDDLVFKVPLWVETPSWVEEADQNQVGALRNVKPRQTVTQTMKNLYGGTEESQSLTDATFNDTRVKNKLMKGSNSNPNPDSLHLLKGKGKVDYVLGIGPRAQPEKGEKKGAQN